MAAPWRANAFSASLLPAPMPPVIATARGRRSGRGLVVVVVGLAGVGRSAARDDRGVLGRLGDRLSDDDLQHIDLNLLDIKSGDPDTYRRITNQPLQPTIDYARRLSALGRPLWVRYVLVPGLSDDFDNVEKVADLCAELKTLDIEHVFPMHCSGPNFLEAAKREMPQALVLCTTGSRFTFGA